MAETRDSRGKDSLPRKSDPTFSHSPDDPANTMPTGGQRLGSKSKRGSWLKKNQTAVIGVAAGVAALAIVLGVCWMTGVFGESKKATPAVAVVQPAATPAAQPQPSTAPQPPPAAVQPPPTEEKKEEPKKEEIPPLPEDVTKWKKEDYSRARHENDPKLLQAVTSLAERFPGNDKAAQCLIDLLKPLPKDKPAEKTASGASGTSTSPGSTPPNLTMPPPGTMPGGPGPRPYDPSSLATLVETIIQGLGHIGNESSRKTLEGILVGTFTTDDDKTAIEATLKTLAAHPCVENDALVLNVLTAADALRSGNRKGPWTARELKTKAFEYAKQFASFNLRTKLAQALLEDHKRIDPKDPVDEFLLMNTALNCGAQTVFYEKANPGKELKATLEQQFVGYSGMALAKFLDIPGDPLPTTTGMPMTGLPAGYLPMPSMTAPGMTPPGMSPSGEPEKPVEIDITPQLAERLWSEGFQGLLEPQLNGLKSFEKQPNIVLLAATIPHDSARATLFKTLRKHWNEGPKPLEAAGLTDRVLTDPALLAMLKLSPRKESMATPKAGDAAKASRAAPPAPPTGGGPRVEAARKELQAKQDWMDVSAKLVTGWCKRFEAATTAKEKAAESDSTSDKPAVEVAESKLPSGFALSTGAKVLASHRVILPEATPASFAQTHPDTLEVYYVRAEESSKPKRAVTFYRSQAGPASAVRTTDGKTWIDSIRVGSQKDRRRSIDVLITRPGTAGTPAPEAKGDDETDLIIEVLIIEIKDPSKDAGKE